MAETITFSSGDDIPALVQLVNSAYRGEGSKQGWTTEADLLDGIRTDPSSMAKQLDAPGSVMLKYADENGHIAGCVYLQKQDDKLYLGMLTVSPLVQAKGIGGKLLHAAEQYGKEQGSGSVIMTVISVRTELIAWYERHGYRRTGETRPFPTGPEFGIPKQHLSFIVLAKDLQ